MRAGLIVVAVGVIAIVVAVVRAIVKRWLGPVDWSRLGQNEEFDDYVDWRHIK